MTDLEQFNKAVAGFELKVVPEKANQFKRAIALQILARVVMMTPVDTGRARGNWQVSINTINIGELSRLDSNGPGTIQTESEKIGDVQPGDAIWIHNNLPYIHVLEDGSSAQAPTGMLRVTLAEIESQFR